MRSSHVCPKCSHREILFVPSLADRDDRDTVRPLMLHVLNLDWKDIEVGTIQAYVCRSCGFTELYTENAGALPVDRIPGAKLLRAKT
jgi:predicted nucleic-acid-binding Zn-ribbon protein